MIAPAKATKSDLCRRLNIARKQLDRVLARKGAPQPQGKRWDVAEVAAWVSRTIGSAEAGDDLKRARIEEVQLRCRRLRLDISERRKELIPRVFAEAYLKQVCLGTRNTMYSFLENTLPVELAGMDDVGKIRMKLRSAGDSICEAMQEGLVKWAEEVAELYGKEHPGDDEPDYASGD